MHNFWAKKQPLNYLLLPLSLLYYAVAKLKASYTKKTKLPATLITVGNLTAGGAGKTPTAIALAGLLKKHDFVFLTRGYKGSITKPTLLNKTHNFLECGDEALLLAEHGRVIVAKRRSKSYDLVKSLKAKLVILDDGLQNNYLQHDIKILVIDADYKFGNGLLLPAGPLRQNLADISDSLDLLVVIGKQSQLDFLPHDLHAKTYLANYVPVKQQKINKQKNYMAFSGLARNEKFFKQLSEDGFSLAATKSFIDHHKYSEVDFINLITSAKEQDAQLITTSKDYVKIPKKYRSAILEYKIELQFDEPQKFLKSLEKLINEKT